LFLHVVEFSVRIYLHWPICMLGGSVSSVECQFVLLLPLHIRTIMCSEYSLSCF
jgi:hypothetical protein